MKNHESFSFVLKGVDDLDGENTQVLVDFYRKRANQFAENHGLTIAADGDIEWSHETDEYLEMIGHPAMAIHEAIVNAREHGNRNDPTKRIQVEAQWNGDAFTFSVTDEGGGFGSSESTGDGIWRGIGRSVIADFATRYMEERRRRTHDGFTVTVTRNLKTKFKEIMRKSDK